MPTITFPIVPFLFGLCGMLAFGAIAADENGCPAILGSLLQIVASVIIYVVFVGIFAVCGVDVPAIAIVR